MLFRPAILDLPSRSPLRFQEPDPPFSEYVTVSLNSSNTLTYYLAGTKGCQPGSQERNLLLSIGLVSRVMEQEPDRSTRRVSRIMDNHSADRGQKAARCLPRPLPNVFPDVSLSRPSPPGSAFFPWNDRIRHRKLSPGAFGNGRIR